MYKVTIILILLLNFALQAQELSKLKSGLTGGISFSAGSHVNRVGIFLQTYTVIDFVQLNLRMNINRDFTGLGACKKGFEFQSNLGLVFSCGNRDIEQRDFFIPNANNSCRPYSFGYSYNIYQNYWETSQNTGTFSLGFDKILIMSENDIFGQPASDKFRTASIRILYIDKNKFFGVNSTLWTGNPKGTLRITDSGYPARYGYREITKGKYGTFSNGILSVIGACQIPYSQTFMIESGIDSEKVRHALQNKFIHDLCFLPKRFSKALNPHYPMLTDKGELYLFKQEQNIKPAKFYYRISGNDILFY